MSGDDSPAPGVQKKSRNMPLAAVVVVLLALVGFITYDAYHQSQCGFGGCGLMDEPVVLSAKVIQSPWTYDCAVVTGGNLGVSGLVVCQILASGGDSGTVVMNLTSEGGNSSVAFGTYSSESQYVHYNSTYSCLYTTTQPDFNSNQSRCHVSQSGSTYLFDYNVSSSLPPQQQIILTITVLKTCCWP